MILKVFHQTAGGHGFAGFDPGDDVIREMIKIARRRDLVALEF